jgi:flagellin-specific chaperone FliS
MQIKFLRATDRFDQCEKDIRELNSIQMVLDSLQKVDLKKVDSKSVIGIILKLKSISRQVEKLDMRRGAAALRYKEIPWKQIAYLHHAIGHIEGNGKDTLNGLISELLQSGELSKLDAFFKKILEEEKKQKLQVEKMITTYKFFEDVLSTSIIERKIDEIKEKSKPYCKINKLLVKLVEICSSEIQLDEDEENFKKILQEICEIRNADGLPRCIQIILDEPLFAQAELTLKNLSIDQIKSISKNLRKVDAEYLKNIRLLEDKLEAIKDGKFFPLRNVTEDLNKILEELTILSKLEKKDKFYDKFFYIREIVFKILVSYSYENKIENTEELKSFLQLILDSLKVECIYLPSDEALTIITQLINKIKKFIPASNETQKALECISRLRNRLLNISIETDSNKKKQNANKNNEKSCHNALVSFITDFNTNIKKLNKDSRMESLQIILNLLEALEQEVRDKTNEDIKSDLTLKDKLSNQVPMLAEMIRWITSENYDLDILSEIVKPSKPSTPWEELGNTIKIKIKNIQAAGKYFPELCVCEVLSQLDICLEKSDSKEALMFLKMKMEKEPSKVLRKENDSEDLNKVAEGLEQAAMGEIVSSEKLSIPTLMSIMDSQFDMQNLNLIIALIDEQIQLDGQCQQKDELFQEGFRRVLLKNLLTIGESMKDLSLYARKNLASSLPIQLFNKLRNVIFHDCIDTIEGRKAFLLFICKDDDKETANMMQDLLFLKEKILEVQERLNQISFQEYKQFYLGQSGKKPSAHPVEKKLIEICALGRDKKIDNKGFANTAKFIQVLKTSTNPESATKLFLCENILVDYVDRIFPIIKDFVREAEDLPRVLGSKIPNVGELSISYCGELSRLLKDNSKFFADNAEQVLLHRLEDLIIKRGYIAHRIAVQSITIKEYEYQELKDWTAKLLKLTRYYLNVMGIDINKLNKLMKSAEVISEIKKLQRLQRGIKELNSLKNEGDKIFPNLSLSTLERLYIAYQYCNGNQEGLVKKTNFLEHYITSYRDLKFRKEANIIKKELNTLTTTFCSSEIIIKNPHAAKACKSMKEKMGKKVNSIEEVIKKIDKYNPENQKKFLTEFSKISLTSLNTAGSNIGSAICSLGKSYIMTCLNFMPTIIDFKIECKLEGVSVLLNIEMFQRQIEKEALELEAKYKDAYHGKPEFIEKNSTHVNFVELVDALKKIIDKIQLRAVEFEVQRLFFKKVLQIKKLQFLVFSFMLWSNDQHIIKKFFAEYEVKIISCNDQLHKFGRKITDLYKPINKYLEVLAGLRNFYEERQIAIRANVAQYIEPEKSIKTLDVDIAGPNPNSYLRIWSQEVDLVDEVEAPKSRLEDLPDAGTFDNDLESPVPDVSFPSKGTF